VEFDGTFTPSITFPTPESCLQTEYTPELGWIVSLTNPGGLFLVEYVLMCGDPPTPSFYEDLFPTFYAEGVFSIYFNYDGVRYGPITMTSSAEQVFNLECY
jgi:hypothetical protein